MTRFARCPSVPKRPRFARCPECGGSYPIERREDEAEVFAAHGDPRDPCSGSGWIVEDEDRLGGRWPR